MLTKDLVRAFYILLLSQTMEGTEERRRGLAQSLTNSSKNAALIREIAAVATSDSPNTDNKLAQMQSLVMDGCAVLGVRANAQSNEFIKLMAQLKQVLDTPDLDVVFNTIIDKTLQLLDQKLEQLAAATQPQVVDPLDPLRRQVRHLIIMFRHEEHSVQTICDEIGMAIGWQCGLLGLPITALPKMTSVFDSIHEMLTDAEKHYSPTL